MGKKLKLKNSIKCEKNFALKILRAWHMPVVSSGQEANTRIKLTKNGAIDSIIVNLENKMQFKIVFITTSLFFLTPLSLAKNINVNIPIEANTQQTASNQLLHEISPSAPLIQRNAPIQAEQFEQSQIIGQIYKNRANRITKYWKRPATHLIERANVRVYLDNKGNVKDILMDGQFSDEFALSIKTAIYKAAPFEMSKQPAFNNQLQEIRIHFTTE